MSSGEEYRSCWLCGRNGSQDPLDRHHIFGGAYRDKSEKYGLVVDLCHKRCHIFGPKAAHHCKETMLELRQYGQRKVMQEQGWTAEDFIREFGRNYLEQEEFMATVKCALGRRGIPTHEWNDGEKDHIYCLGRIDLRTEEALPECRACPDFVDKAADDYEEWRRQNKK